MRNSAQQYCAKIFESIYEKVLAGRKTCANKNARSIGTSSEFCIPMWKCVKFNALSKCATFAIFLSVAYSMYNEYCVLCILESQSTIAAVLQDKEF